MTNTYGPFLLSGIPGDAIETEAQCLALLEQFARKGFCSPFREIIQERVVEVSMVDKTPTHRWLEGEEAEAVLSVREQRGWASYSLFDYLDGIGTVFTPNGRKKGSYKLKLETGDTFEIYVLPASSATSMIRAINTRLQGYGPEHWETASYPLEMYLELHDSLISGLEACQKAGVIYRF